MRTLLLLLLLLLSFSSVLAQTNILSIEEASQESVDISEIEKQYADAVNANPELAVFNGREDAFITSYRQMIQDISSHLSENGFNFKSNTRMFTRIYFSPKGTIDHFYYSKKQAGFSAEEEKTFNTLLQPFLSNYQINEEADRPFAQCSPVVFAAGK